MAADECHRPKISSAQLRRMKDSTCERPEQNNLGPRDVSVFLLCSALICHPLRITPLVLDRTSDQYCFALRVKLVHGADKRGESPAASALACEEVLGADTIWLRQKSGGLEGMCLYKDAAERSVRRLACANRCHWAVTPINWKNTVASCSSATSEYKDHTMKRWVFDEVQDTCPNDWIRVRVPNTIPSDQRRLKNGLFRCDLRNTADLALPFYDRSQTNDDVIDDTGSPMTRTLAMTVSNDHSNAGADIVGLCKINSDRRQYCIINPRYGIEKFKQLMRNELAIPKRATLQFSSGGLPVFKKTTPIWEVT